MTKEQRHQAPALCERILKTAVRLEADLHAAAVAIAEETENTDS